MSYLVAKPDAPRRDRTAVAINRWFDGLSNDAEEVIIGLWGFVSVISMVLGLCFLGACFDVDYGFMPWHLYFFVPAAMMIATYRATVRGDRVGVDSSLLNSALNDYNALTKHNKEMAKPLLDRAFAMWEDQQTRGDVHHRAIVKRCQMVAEMRRKQAGIIQGVGIDDYDDTDIEKAQYYINNMDGSIKSIG